MPQTLGLGTYTLDAGFVATVVNAQAVTGANAQQFCVQPRGDSGDRTLVLSATGVGAVPTTVTADLECSSDGGSTWQKVSTGLALIAAGVATVQTVKNIVAGLVYRINITALTLGSATAANVNAALS